MADDDVDEVEQYSEASRERLRQAARSLMAAIEQHTLALLELSGGTSVLDTVSELNSTVEQATAAWDDAVFDHTGVFPLALDLDEPNGESDDDAAAAITVNGVGQALYALAHEFGEPWFELPGVEVVGGLRAYLQRDPDEQVVGTDEDDDTFVPIVPNGDVLFSESW